MERKLAAIVAADVVDYSLLLGQNEAAVLGALARLRHELIDPAAGAYGGRIFRLMGDGSLFEFNSALSAIEFAVTIQRAKAERRGQPLQGLLLQLRMGVALGDIVVDGDDIHGDGVNIAARLEALAPPGGICISRTVFDQIKPPHSEGFQPLGERHLKNIAVPVGVWRWLPPDAAQPDATQPDTGGAGRFAANGRQILDPKVTALIVDLHMRSALLAASEAFDEILTGPDEGRGLQLDALYSRFGDKINKARHMLGCINVESTIDLEKFGQWQSPLIMSEFISNVFDDSATAYAMRLLPQIQAVLQSDQPAVVKRLQLMEIIRTFLNDEMTPKTKRLIKFAFVDV